MTGRTAKGQTFPAYLSVRCIVDAGGQTIGTVGVLRDLTEQVETQRRLIQRTGVDSLDDLVEARRAGPFTDLLDLWCEGRMPISSMPTSRRTRAGEPLDRG